MAREISRQEFERLQRERGARRLEGMPYYSIFEKGDIAKEMADRVSPEVRDARRQAAMQFLHNYIGRHGDPYQKEIPGVGATLMALRSDAPVTPQQRHAAGEAGVGWMYGGQPEGVNAQQLSIDFNAPPPVNTVKGFARQQQEVAAAAQQAKVPVSISGRQMAMRFGLPLLGAMLGTYGLAALADRPEESMQPAQRS